jgi:hypothetical protein
VYVKSFKGYGIMAARAKILQLAGADGTHPCVPEGFEGGCKDKCYGLEPGEVGPCTSCESSDTHTSI